MNDLKKQLLSELGGDYEINQDEEVFFVKTPLRYDDGDYVVIFITPQLDHCFILDDNGDTSIRLMFEGVDLDSPPAQIWIKNACAIHQLQWDPERDAFWCKATRQNLVEKITRVAQVSIQMQALVVLRSTVEVVEQRTVWSLNLQIRTKLTDGISRVTLEQMLTKIIAMQFSKQLEQLFTNIGKKPELKLLDKLFPDFIKVANDEQVTLPMKYCLSNNKRD